MNRKNPLKLFALVAAMMCALGSQATEAYACYTSSNTTLTFYYDTHRSSRSGTTYDLNTGNNNPAWYEDDTYANVTRVVFDSSFAYARPTTTYRWFFYMTELTSIMDINNLNTSEVTNMSNMFSICTALTSLDLSHLNTAKVTDMSLMFAICSRLTGLDLTSFNTSGVTNMNGMFYGCSGLTSLDLRSFNTAKVTYMSDMFGRCSDLVTIYAGCGWSTAAGTISDRMFKYCTSLVGGMGTTYDANHDNAEYAHIDGGPSNPGYFSAKSTALRGDANGDDAVTIADVSALIDYLQDSSNTVNMAGADCNMDNYVTIADVSALIDYLLAGSWN